MSTKKLFNFQDEKSAEFWEISQSEEVVTIRFGKSGTNGQNQSKTFVDFASASQHVQKLIAEKLFKGYVEQDDTGPSTSDLGSRPSNKLASTKFGAIQVCEITLPNTLTPRYCLSMSDQFKISRDGDYLDLGEVGIKPHKDYLSEEGFA